MPEQSWMLARVVNPAAAPPTVRVLGEEQGAPGVPGLAERAPGQVVLLREAGGGWDRVLPLRALEPWPAVLGAPEAWGPGQPRREPLALRVRGAWALDPAGEPCELAWAELEGRVRVVSYAGWTLAGLERLELPWTLHEVGGERLIRLGPEARAAGRAVRPPLTLPERELPEWLGLELGAEGAPPEDEAPPATPPPRPPSAVAPIALEQPAPPAPPPAPAPEPQGTLSLFGWAEPPTPRRRR